jgi:hypothetical protein
MSGWWALQKLVVDCRRVWMFDVLIAGRSAGGDHHDSRYMTAVNGRNNIIAALQTADSSITMTDGLIG